MALFITTPYSIITYSPIKQFFIFFIEVNILAVLDTIQESQFKL